MKKLSVEELAELVKISGANAEEEAAALAVIHSVLNSRERTEIQKKSAWQRGRKSLRGQLGTEWEGELRR